MKKNVLALLIVIALCTFAILNTEKTYAQANQLWETIVGSPEDAVEPGSVDSGGAAGGVGEGEGGTNEDLPVGIFKPPFKCGNVMRGSTYAGPKHVWEIDFNKCTSEDRGDPVFATAPGTVVGVGSENPGRVIIYHKGGYRSLYGHMINIRVKNNQKVKLHEKIGEIGDVAAPGQNHLHYSHYRYSWNDGKGLVQVKFDGKAHPASRPGNVTINTCPGVGKVDCKVLY